MGKGHVVSVKDALARALRVDKFSVLAPMVVDQFLGDEAAGLEEFRLVGGI